MVHITLFSGGFLCFQKVPAQFWGEGNRRQEKNNCGRDEVWYNITKVPIFTRLGRKHILWWNFLWICCKENLCLSVLFGREKGREDIMCGSCHLTSHWPRLPQGWNSLPLCFQGTSLGYSESQIPCCIIYHFIQVPEVEMWCGVDQAWCLEISKLCSLQLRDLITVSADWWCWWDPSNGNSWEHKQHLWKEGAIKGELEKKHTNLGSGLLNAVRKHAYQPKLEEWTWRHEVQWEAGFNNSLARRWSVWWAGTLSRKPAQLLSLGHRVPSPGSS